MKRITKKTEYEVDFLCNGKWISWTTGETLTEAREQRKQAKYNGREKTRIVSVKIIEERTVLK